MMKKCFSSPKQHSHDQRYLRSWSESSKVQQILIFWLSFSLHLFSAILAKHYLLPFLDYAHLSPSLTLIQPGKGRFALTYMSPDHLHGSHAGLSGWIRVKLSFLVKSLRTMQLSLMIPSYICFFCCSARP